MFDFEMADLHASRDCRASFPGEEPGTARCFSRTQWEQVLRGEGYGFERARYAVSQALAVEGVDSRGVLRKLLLGESVNAESQRELREAGFVHVFAATGTHLYAVLALWEWASGKLVARIAFSGPRAADVFRRLGWLLPFVLWAFAGQRPGMLRPIFLWMGRALARELGFRFSPMSALGVAMVIDALIAAALTWGDSLDFSEWAPGRAHYLLAVAGGTWGASWARRRRWGAWGTHAAMAVFSWLAVLGLDLLAGHGSWATPILSLVTFPLLASVIYPLGLLGSALLAFTGGTGFEPLAIRSLQWLAWMTTAFLEALHRGVVQAGWVFQVSPVQGRWALVLLLLGAGLFAYRRLCVSARV